MPGALAPRHLGDSMYLWIKYTHVAAAIVSISGFVLRGLWMLADSPLLRARLVRVAPHVVDTALLASAVALALMSRQYPLQSDWLSAKVTALVAYILLGMLALRPGRPKLVRAAAFAAALGVFAYIVAVALSRRAWPL